MKNMHKVNLYLREDQIQFLKTLPNASQFVRESLDMQINNTERTQAEKTISIFNGIKELTTRIQDQKNKVEQAEKEAIIIEEQHKKAQKNLKLLKEALTGNFQIEHNYSGYKTYITTTEGKRIILTEDQPTEEQARTATMKKLKAAIHNYTQSLEQTTTKKHIHSNYLQAEKTKLASITDNLQKLQTTLTRNKNQ